MDKIVEGKWSQCETVVYQVKCHLCEVMQINSSVVLLVDTVKGLTLKFEDISNGNTKRDKFCSNYIGYGAFCTSKFQVCEVILSL